MKTRPVGLTVVAVLMAVTAIGTLLFWVTFFADLEAQRTGHFALQSASWFAWELSFPLADAWMSLTALLAAVGLWRMRPSGLSFSLVSSGAMVFLGLMDALFFLQNGLYVPLSAEVIVEMTIHIWTIAFGLAAMVTVWKHRHTLLPADNPH